MALGWEHRVSGSQRFSSQGPWLSDRVGGDRGTIGGLSRGAASGGTGARGQRGGKRLVAYVTEHPGAELSPTLLRSATVHGAARVHGSERLCHAGDLPADIQREAGSQRIASAGSDRGRERRIPGARGQVEQAIARSGKRCWICRASGATIISSSSAGIRLPPAPRSQRRKYLRGQDWCRGAVRIADPKGTLQSACPSSDLRRNPGRSSRSSHWAGRRLSSRSTMR